MTKITTHVLDTARGIPAAGIAVRLDRFEAGEWREAGRGTTNDDGRVAELSPDGIEAPARLRLHFATGPYHGDGAFFPFVEIVFEVEAAQARMQRHEDGTVTGLLGGGIAIQALSDLAHNTGIGAEVEELLDSVLGISADLAPGPDGQCEQISVVLEVEAIPAFFYD